MKTKSRKASRRKRAAAVDAKAQIAGLSKPRYELEVRYLGLDKELDKEIERVVGRKPSGTGMLMHLALRDITFDFGSRERDALEAIERPMRDLPGVRVFMRSFEEATK